MEVIYSNVTVGENEKLSNIDIKCSVPHMADTIHKQTWYFAVFSTKMLA